MRGKFPAKLGRRRTAATKIHPRCQGGRAQKIKIRYILTALVLAGAGLILPARPAQADGCPSLRVVFARGSGGERWTDKNYLAFKEGIEEKLKTVALDYEFIDLDYPAIGIGIDNLSVTAGALFGAGDAYEFGESIDAGVEALAKMVNSDTCPGTKYVIGGYSQGAMVVSKSLRYLKADRIAYAATFGDPKIYLPEGKGLMPAACSGGDLSDYRMYVPDCHAYKGMLGSYIPYEPEGFTGKVGTWCNKRDIFCSSYLVINDHVAYVADNLYEDASRVIFDKICKTFALTNRVSSPHDTAILIDSTGSMSSMIEKYKSEALRLAKETLESGGRVALFDYRDLDDPYDLVQHCAFEDCTLEKFEDELASIQTDGGGDTPESLLSASWHAMNALEWKKGSTKSLVVLTDANFHPSEKDGITMDKVVDLSKRIDPVNFYIITGDWCADAYTELATRTDGKVVTDFDELSLLTDYIMERYDSLPRVEEETVATDLPTLEVEKAGLTDGTATISYRTTGTQVMVALNDKILGATEADEVTFTGIDIAAANTVTLVPLSADRRGEAVAVTLESAGYGGGSSTSGDVETGDSMEIDAGSAELAIPKAPATGRR